MHLHFQLSKKAEDPHQTSERKENRAKVCEKEVSTFVYHDTFCLSFKLTFASIKQWIILIARSFFRLDRNVPVMYNSLDVNSQEPFMFDTNSQSQALPSAPVTPEKVVEVSPPKPVTPGFSLRKMLFLSPQPNAGASTEANQSVAAKTLATLPLSSPDILTSQSDQEHAPSVSRITSL